MEKLTEVLAQQLSMGGYAAYVWPSFAIATLVLAGMVVASVRELRKAQRALNDLKSLQSNET